MARTKEFMTNEFKKSCGDSMMRHLLVNDPNLSRIQVQRIFQYTYGRLLSKKGRQIYEQNKHYSKFL